ncbi:synaptic vesicle VAT-1 family membrane protein [Couchioplanes caeruleus]|uniref:Alcohol dehydrogenase n=2 Tax=Couchioplanes caeruleus TaxID=56438 RepID=A0A1K0FA24_9ACTN|nr:medium chain dehydrogenase/reductase family protein [Couchioplanes caeruleus]OJF09725.1 alcohol dehydrogenase [Couchioplanes caeruleus subsp. caeruleus]ROP27396.1 NADPH:quinone reductase-like Zn-dependent oxidoreductase [Couchioplanes caeruleus]
MRAIWITKPGGTEVLAVRESTDPQPDRGEVRITVRATGLNFAEVMARQGLYPDAPKPPCVVGYEVAGVVDALGAEVTGLEVGQRVLALVRFGGHADSVCAPVERVLPMPDGLSFTDGAALPVNYLTAYHMLFRVANLRRGARVLVHMAAGGVGIAVLQLCRTVPDIVTFGTASAAKHDVLREEGCTHPIDYRTEDYAARVRELTGGEGVDLVLDPLGGRDWKRGLRLLRPVGQLVAYGFANLSTGERRSIRRMAAQLTGVPVLTPFGMMDRNHTVSGVNLGHLWDRSDLLREELAALLDLWRQGAVKPRIDGVYPFAEAAAAHRRIGERRNIGKVVLVP